MENAKHGRRAFLRVAGGGAAVALSRGVDQASSQATAPAVATSSSDLCFKSAKDLAALLRARKVSAREVMAAHLVRINQVNPTINAIVAKLDDQKCLALADAADQRA